MTPEMTLPLAAKLLSHPIRAALLDAYVYCDPPGLSPSDLAEQNGENLPVVSYHTRILAQAGAIRQTQTKQVRGALEHFYVGTDAGDRVLALKDVWGDGA